VKSMGYSPEELYNINYREYTDEENAEHTFRLYNSVFKTGQTVKNLEIGRINKQGEKILVELSVSLARDNQGNPVGFHTIQSGIRKAI